LSQGQDIEDLALDGRAKNNISIVAILLSNQADNQLLRYYESVRKKGIPTKRRRKPLVKSTTLSALR
jgi:hypothetical protein